MDQDRQRLRERQQRQVDENYEVFERQLPEFLAEHEDEFAIMRDGEVVAFMPTTTAALREAHRRFPDEIFSIQEVTDKPLDIGIFSHAGS